MHSSAEDHITIRAFDLAARFYDEEQAGNAVARWSRKRSLGVLARAFAQGDRVLEIGCGTGEEALWLAGRGVHVLATDASPEMVNRLRAKLAALPACEQPPGRIRTQVLPAGDFVRLRESEGEGSFDGAYSSFGPLNCEPRLEPVAETLAHLVKPGGRVVISLLNRYCLWETAWYLLNGDPRKGFRRWGGHTLATVRGEWQDERLRVPVWYWTPGEVERAFAPAFRTVRRLGLPWLLPPQYLSKVVERRPRLFALLARFDRALAATWPFYALGDHYLLELVRTPAPSGPVHVPVERSAWKRAAGRLLKRGLALRYRHFAPGAQPAREVRVRGLRLLIPRTVFDPSIHFTSAFLLDHLRRPGVIGRGSTVLDVGTGTGIAAIGAAQAGAEAITAVDINPAALRAARANLRANRVGSQVRVLKSDMFEAVAGEQFDVLICNPPYFRGEALDIAEAAYMGGPELDWIRRLAAEAPRHLRPGGKLILVLGDAGDVAAIASIFADAGWRIFGRSMKDVLVEVLYIYEMEPQVAPPDSGPESLQHHDPL